LKESTDLLARIGPRVARKMSKALQSLTAGELKVEFGNIETFEQSAASIDVGEKCFGSCVKFRGPGDDLQGAVTALFPRSSVRILIELLLKRYLGNSGKETVDDQMKLSTFKEATNILLLTHITEIANSLKVRLQPDVPEFLCFDGVRVIEPGRSSDHSTSHSAVSVADFRITGGRSRHLIKGIFLLFLTRSSKGG